jgi:hypothetical protein
MDMRHQISVLQWLQHTFGFLAYQAVTITDVSELASALLM